MGSRSQELTICPYSRHFVSDSGSMPIIESAERRSGRSGAGFSRKWSDRRFADAIAELERFERSDFLQRYEMVNGDCFE